jgi:hypothetical protein
MLARGDNLDVVPRESITSAVARRIPPIPERVNVVPRIDKLAMSRLKLIKSTTLAIQPELSVVDSHK